MDLLISKEYRKQLEGEHEDRYWGGTGRKHASEILEIAKKYKCFDVLDYGSSNHKDCLKRHFHRNYPGELLFYEYDPAVSSKSAMPDPAHMVVCTDVLEHVEPELLDNVLQHIDSCMLRCGFLVISNIPAFSILPDGRNAHLIQESKDWWQAKLGEFFDLKQLWWTKSETRAMVTKR